WPAPTGEYQIEVHPLCCGWMSCDAGTMLSGASGPFTLPVLAFLVEHPLGLVLFDTGLHPDLISSSERMGRVAQYFTPPMDYTHTGAAQRAARGVTPAGISIIVASHLHFDHCGGNAQIPNARLAIQQAEWDAAHDERLLSAEVYFSADFDVGHEVMLLDGEYDLFGDGMLRLVPTPGHTKGHQSLVVEDRMVLVGDACYCR